jgi:hypothetical protein
MRAPRLLPSKIDHVSSTATWCVAIASLPWLPLAP